MKETEKYRFANETATDIGIQYEIPTDGLFQVHWSNGNLRYEWYYKNGKRADGVSSTWFESGQLKATRTWKNGMKSGPYSIWFENGQKQYEGTFKDGEQEGLHTKWYSNGQKRWEGTFNDGKLIDEMKWPKDETK
jgi:antitoxin component YwqK of YwqJK toxin-antitoxin module